MTPSTGQFPPNEKKLPVAPCGARKARPGAYTIIELLTVIAIIGILITILVPSFTAVRLTMKRKLSQSAINTIDAACNAYYNDFHDYPPSRDDRAGSPYRNWSGGELIALLLLGYAPDVGNDGSPRTGLSPIQETDLSNDDGQAGFGYRLHARGKTYGPYGGTEKLSLARGGNAYIFKDALDNDILYYKFGNYEKGGDIVHYDADHNPGPDQDFLDPPGGTPSPYTCNQDGRYYRRDFILISPGPDGRFNERRLSASDDVTNMVTSLDRM